MRYDVVTVARTLGAGGEDLGERIADALGFRYVDDEIIDRAAALAGVTPVEIAQTEERPGVVRRVMAALLGPSGAPSRKASGSAGTPWLEDVIVDVIKETAAMELVVIVAHGAAVPLAGRAGVLRVLATASTETRVRRVAADEGIDQELASKRVTESDAARADFFQRFYRIPQETPTMYDLVINTDVLSIDEASAAVLTLVRG